MLFGALQPFYNWESSISRQIRHVFNMRVHEGELNDAINYAQKGCAVQMWGMIPKASTGRWNFSRNSLWFSMAKSRLSSKFLGWRITWRLSSSSSSSSLKHDIYPISFSNRLGDRFREHLRDVEKDDKNASKPVARHFNLSNHSMQHMAVCGLSLHQGNTESRKTLEQKFIFQIGTLNPHGINERFSFN